MSIVKKIGDKIKSLLSISPKASVDKITLSDQMESQISTLTGINNALMSTPVKTRISQIVKNKKATGGHKEFNTWYQSFYNDLQSPSQIIERKSPFESVRQSVALTIKDLSDLLENLDQFLGQGADISINDLRVSGITLIGYVEQVSDAIDWINYMLNFALSDDTATTPPYVTDIMSALTDNTVSWVDRCMIQGRHTPLVTTLTNITQSDANANLMAGSHSLDSFMSDKDLPSLTLDTGSQFLRSPSVMISERAALHKKERLDKLKTQRDWLQNKVALLQLQMANVDPESPEYQKLQKIVDNYNEMITANEQKIKRHEITR